MHTEQRSKDEDYIVLARKYRPKNFLELKGQDVLVQTISNGFKEKKLPHALLLTGIRGVGKTTTARIVAKTLNCTSPLEKNNLIVNCEQCNNCVAFHNNKHPDYLEMDAASKTGVGDIREILDNCRYLPQISKYKIYVIDEVHMLSMNAFNALLKTLEEPPAHVVFIFATTEIRKVPVTILSRCQRFDLARLNSTELVLHLQEILKKENLDADAKALELISKCSEGSVRDSLSLLDQSILFAQNKKITEQTVRSILGMSDKTNLIELYNYIITGETKKAVQKIDQFYFDGIELNIVLNDLLDIINVSSLCKYSDNDFSFTAYYNDSEIEKIKTISSSFSIEFLTSLWQIITSSVEELKYSPSILSSVQMTMIKACHFSNLPLPSEIIQRLKSSEEDIKKKNLG